jgi:putative flippase GtrA
VRQIMDKHSYIIFLGVIMTGRTIERQIMKLLQKFFTPQTSETLIQLVKSLFVGGVATLADMGVLYLLEPNLGYILASIISFTIGLVINYIITSLWVFNKSSIKDKRIEFIIFTVIALAGLGLNTLFMWLFTDILKFYFLVSKAFATIIVYGFNFSARKIIIYK